ncbi:MAG: hypothetical protein JXB49_05650 [Bacteroidales bacterium]|nr:hypothetical protein [Bacteroidales bacterium]
MEANIVNLTSASLSIDFAAAPWDSSLSKTLQIESGQTVLFEIYDGYGTYVGPNLGYFDSVVIRNEADEILSVNKQGDIGKNIFNIDEYWISTEQTKRFFIYVYEIEDEDLEKFFVAL